MERKHVEEYEGLSIYFSFFSWKQCSKCKKDFRREKIWQTWAGPWCGYPAVERCLCMGCAPTKKEAYKFFTNKPHKPDPPPPPPKRRLGRWNL